MGVTRNGSMLHLKGVEQSELFSGQRRVIQQVLYKKQNIILKNIYLFYD